MHLFADLVDPLHAEISHWNWLADGRTLLTVGAELVTLTARSCVHLYLSRRMAWRNLAADVATPENTP